MCREEKVIIDLNEEEIARTCYKKELQEKNQTKCRLKNIIKKKGDELYMK